MQNKACFSYAEPQPILCKDSARRMQNKACFSYAEPQPILCKDSASNALHKALLYGLVIFMI